MIAFKGGALKHGRRIGKIPRFDAGIYYLHFGKYKSPDSLVPPPPGPSRVSWVTTRNLLTEDSWLSAGEMYAVSQRNLRVRLPGYHMGASLPPGEALDREQWETVADAMLRKLGLAEHQAVIALHEDKGHQHVHVIANRVRIGGHVWKPEFDEKKLTQVMREMERRFNLRRVPTKPRAMRDDDPEEKPPVVWDEKQAAKRIRRVLVEPLREVRTWDELDAILAKHGIRLEPAKCGGGAMAREGEHRIRMSEIDRGVSGPKLAKRFGESLRDYIARVDARPSIEGGIEVIALEDAKLTAKRIIDELELRHATWSVRELRNAAAHRHDLDEVVDLATRDARVTRVTIDQNGDIRYTTHENLVDETLLFQSAKTLSARSITPAPVDHLTRLLEQARDLTAAQREAVQSAVMGGDLGLITGTAESGKTTVAQVIARSYRDAGHAVIGIAPTARAAYELETAAEIDARSLDAWRYAWRKGQAIPQDGSVFIVDDAAQIETRRLARLLARVERTGGKAILVGDDHGLQPVGPGAPFRGLTARHDPTTLPHARFGLEPWEREVHASDDVSKVVEAYRARGRFHWEENRQESIERVAERTLEAMDEHPRETVLAMTSTRAEATAINAAIRRARAARGELTEVIQVGRTEIGVGDRVRFRRGDRRGRHVESRIDSDEAVVIAGDLGTVRAIDDAGRIVVERDRGEADPKGHLRFDPARYDEIEHAYALNVHQAAARKVDRAVVFLSRFADRHQVSVTLSRHRKSAEIVADRETFPSGLDLLRLMHRDREKDMVADYAQLLLGGSLSEQALDVVHKLESHAATWTRGNFLRVSGRRQDLLDELETLPDVLRLSKGTYTTRRYLEAELAMIHDVERLATAAQSAPSLADIERIASKHDLSEEQRTAFAHVTARRLGLITGRAGSGKTRLSRALVEHYAAHGKTVRGAALAGKAADGLSKASGIEAQTLAAWIAGWERSEGHLSARDVLVVDEASMVDVPTLAKVTNEVERAGADLILIGDPLQLPPIGAGDAFRALLERNESVALDEIRRQRHDWQIEASRLAGGARFGKVIQAYIDHDAVHTAPDEADAVARLIDRYLEQDDGQFRESIILAHRRDDVAWLNREVHTARHQRGDIETGVRIRGIEISAGDRIILGANDPNQQHVTILEGEGGVRNGALGTIESIEKSAEPLDEAGAKAAYAFRVRLDDGRLISFDPRRYQRFDLGYATTIHKAQGITVERAHVYASQSLDRSTAYVAFTRHREALELYVPTTEFPSRESLVASLVRKRPKALVLDGVQEGRAIDLLVSKQPRRALFDPERDLERPPIVLDSPLDAQALRVALDRYNANLENKATAESISAAIRKIERDTEQRVQQEVLGRFMENLPTIYRDANRVRVQIENVARRHGLLPTVESVGREPERYGHLKRRSFRLNPKKYAQELAAWAVEHHGAITSDPATQEKRSELARQLESLESKRLDAGARDQLRFELGALAHAIHPTVIDRLSADDQTVVRELLREQESVLRAARSALAKIEGMNHSVADESAIRRMEQALAPFLRAAKRHALYRISPRALRALIRASTYSKNPQALLLMLAPPQLRPLIYVATLVRSAIKSKSRSKSSSQSLGR